MSYARIKEGEEEEDEELLAVAAMNVGMYVCARQCHQHTINIASEIHHALELSAQYY